MVSDDEYRRIRWQSRRGMLELDVLLTPFVEHHFRSLDEGQQHTYRALLEHDDAVLMDWFNRGVTPPDPALAELVALIRGLRANGEHAQG